MTETKRWAIAIILSFVGAIGGNYWMTSITQARIDERLHYAETSILALKSVDTVQTDSIMQNKLDIQEISTGWKSIGNAVKDNTAQLARFTEVLIRMEERDRLKNAE